MIIHKYIMPYTVLSIVVLILSLVGASIYKKKKTSGTSLIKLVTGLTTVMHVDHAAGRPYRLECSPGVAIYIVSADMYSGPEPQL